MHSIFSQICFNNVLFNAFLVRIIFLVIIIYVIIKKLLTKKIINELIEFCFFWRSISFLILRWFCWLKWAYVNLLDWFRQYIANIIFVHAELIINIRLTQICYRESFVFIIILSKIIYDSSKMTILFHNHALFIVSSIFDL